MSGQCAVVCAASAAGAAVHALLGDLPRYTFAFVNASAKTKWQLDCTYLAAGGGGILGDVAVDSSQGSLVAQGYDVPFAGTLTSNTAGATAWTPHLINNNAGQASESRNQALQLRALAHNWLNAVSRIEGMAVALPPGILNGKAPTALDLLNVQNSVAETFVIDVDPTDVQTPIRITGDASDLFILVPPVPTLRFVLPWWISAHPRRPFHAPNASAVGQEPEDRRIPGQSAVPEGRWHCPAWWAAAQQLRACGWRDHWWRRADGHHFAPRGAVSRTHLQERHLHLGRVQLAEWGLVRRVL